MADSYVNTRTIMGDQEAFDALIAGELEDLVEDGVTSISKSYAIYQTDGIKSIKLPNLANMNSNAIQFNANLEVVDIGKKCTFGSSSLTYNSKLDSLILRGASMSTHGSTMLNATPIAIGHGGVFVPSDLVSTYKANSSWGAYNIYPIEDYPKSDWGTITDSWSEIFSNESNGTYSTKYSLGDTKKITINNNDYYAQIVAVDADPLSDNSGNNAKTTWILKELYSDTHRMNATSTNANGWPDTEMRSWLNDTVLPLIPSDVRTAIKEVTKTSYDKTTSADVTSNDKLWIPSAREVFTSSSYGYESSGPTYTTVFDSSSARIKYKGTSASTWWLRSALSSGTSHFQYVSSSGSSNFSSANGTIGVCLGFCT